jgi:hypothetical protein
MRLLAQFRDRTTRLVRDERGIMLVSVAMIVLVAVSFMAVAATRTVEDKKATDLKLEYAEAFYAAQAGEHAMKAAIMQNALERFEVIRANWDGTGWVLEHPESFFAPHVTLPGAVLPNGECFETVHADLSFVGPPEISIARQAYMFMYTITSQGTNPDMPDRMVRIISQGNFQIASNRQSFANYALFTNMHTLVDGTRVWFTSDTNFTGRVHTNDRFAFAYNPTFSNGMVTSVADDAYFYNNGHPRLLNADDNAPHDVPAFGEGFERGVDPILLPDNAFDQREASVGGPAADNAELRTSLGLPSSSTAPPDGIYIPNDGASLTGGIYVQGSVSDLSLYVDAGGNQCYQIVHSNGTTANVVVDQLNNRTTVNSITYQGTPNGALYVAGDINSLGGPARSGDESPPAIQSETALSVFSEGDVVITRDIVYETDPLTVADSKNVLGIFTPGGDVRIGASAPDDISIHATLMTSDANGVVQVDGYSSGSPRGTATVLGGVISSYYGAFGTFGSGGIRTGYARNFVYDQRLGGGLAPPFFPTTPFFDPATVQNVNETNWQAHRVYLAGHSDDFELPESEPEFDPDFSG